MPLLPRPNPDGEICPFCFAENALSTKQSYCAPMADGTFRNADNIECNECKNGFWIGWVSEGFDGVIMQPRNGL